MDMLGSFLNHNDAERHYNDIYYTEQVRPHHRSSWTHEAVAGAAGFAAMRAYENHLRATGQQPTHQVMKEILAAIAAAEVDKLAETRGMDWIDRERAKRQAGQQAHYLADQRYGGRTGWEHARGMQGPAEAYNFGGGYGGGYALPQPPQGYVPVAGYAPQQGYGAGYGPAPGQGMQDGAFHHGHHHGHHQHHHHEKW